MNVLQSLLGNLGVLFSYKAVSGAVVVKLLQLVLSLSGHAPWDDAHASAVEGLVDALVALLAAFGVVKAHNADPNAPKV